MLFHLISSTALKHTVRFCSISFHSLASTYTRTHTHTRTHTRTDTHRQKKNSDVHIHTHAHRYEQKYLQLNFHSIKNALAWVCAAITLSDDFSNEFFLILSHPLVPWNIPLFSHLPVISLFLSLSLSLFFFYLERVA